MLTCIFLLELEWDHYQGTPHLVRKVNQFGSQSNRVSYKKIYRQIENLLPFEVN